MFEGKILPVKFLQTCTNCNILKYSRMARERVVERTSCSANGNVCSLAARTASGVASVVHLFLSFSGIFPHNTLSMRYVNVLAKHMMRSAICWDFTRCRIVVYYRRFGATNQSHFKRQAVQKKFLHCSTFDMEPTCYPETLGTDSTILHRVKSQKISGLMYTAAEA
jgi:hypothetical protein